MSGVWMACIIAALAEGFLHYFPWRLLLGKDLPRPAAYVLGVLAFAVPYGVWLWRRAPMAAMALAAVVAAAGAAVVGLYALDWVLDAARARKEAEAREQVIKAAVLDEQA